MTTAAGLFPAHDEDLHKSGLSDAMIRDASLYSVDVSAVEPLLGWRPPIESALVFPYPGEPGFCRVKVFPAYHDDDGSTVRYLQPANSGCRFYIPPGVEKILTNPLIPLAWTEGEKKALKACQEGCPCIALAGLWSWRHDGKPLAALDAMAHADRQELLVCDSHPPQHFLAYLHIMEYIRHSVIYKTERG